jgi:hypothetical protein
MRLLLRTPYPAYKQALRTCLSHYYTDSLEPCLLTECRHDFKKYASTMLLLNEGHFVESLGVEVACRLRQSLAYCPAFRGHHEALLRLSEFVIRMMMMVSGVAFLVADRVADSPWAGALAFLVMLVAGACVTDRVLEETVGWAHISA